MSHAKIQTRSEEEAQSLATLLEDRHEFNAMATGRDVLVDEENEQIAQWGLDHLRSK